MHYCIELRFLSNTLKVPFRLPNPLVNFSLTHLPGYQNKFGVYSYINTHHECCMHALESNTGYLALICLCSKCYLYIIMCYFIFILFHKIRKKPKF